MSGKLAEFIRARREAVTPAMAGLPGGGRRRTPGLRREELARAEAAPAAARGPVLQSSWMRRR